MDAKQRHARALRINGAIRHTLESAAIMCGLNNGDSGRLDFRLHRIIVTADQRSRLVNYTGLDAPSLAGIIAAFEMTHPDTALTGE